MVISCFNCAGDHFARDCPQSKDKVQAKGAGKGCFTCGGDHFARDCPKADKQGKGGKGGGGVCYDFRDTGKCRFGEACRFSHET